MQPPAATDVLIVGAGPTGLVTACLLQKSGINTTVIDSAADAATTSRAAIIHLRTLEVMEKLDLSLPIIKQGVPIKSMILYDKTAPLSCLEFTDLHDRYKHAVALPQADTEAHLTQKLHELGGKIYRNCQLLKVLQNDQDGVKLSVRNDSAQDTQTITAKYCVAADGLHSSLRHELDIPFPGDKYDLAFVAADIHLDPTKWPHQSTREQGSTYFSPSGFLLVIPFPSKDNTLWRIVATVAQAPQTPDLDFLDDIMRTRGPFATVPQEPIVKEVTWSSHFRINHRLAAQYRKNRIFLAGDAAHVHSPAGGQGMNTGIQDAEQLASILADALLSDRDSEEDLNRYEKLRRPVAQGVVRATHTATLVMTMTNPVLTRVRNWLLWTVGNLVPGLRRYISWRMSELEH